MTQEQFDYLKKFLAWTLVKENRIHETFDFSSYNEYHYGEIKGIANCGTNGCRMGELPGFDNRVTFDEDGDILFDKKYRVLDAANKLFGLTYEEFKHLFYRNFRTHTYTEEVFYQRIPRLKK